MPESPQTTNSAQTYTRKLSCSLEELATGATKRLKVKLTGGREQIYTVHLKKGWKAGTKIKFPPRKGFPAMNFVLQEKRHADLQRKGDDLVHTIHTPHHTTAVYHVRLTLPDGQDFSRKIKVPKGGNQREVTIPGKGMPIKGGPQHGDLILRFS